MSRRKTKAEDIRNPERYFNRYMAKEAKKEQDTKNRYYSVFDSLDELLATNRIGNESKILLATNAEGEDFERLLSDTNLLAWIDLIENPTLYTAVSSLPKKDKVFLTLRYKYVLSQTELSEILGVSQATISKRETALKNFFGNFLEKGYKKQRFYPYLL